MPAKYQDRPWVQRVPQMNKQQPKSKRKYIDGAFAGVPEQERRPLIVGNAVESYGL